MTKSSKCLYIFILLPVFIALLFLFLWSFIVPQDLKDTVGILRWRRNVTSPSISSPEWMDQMIQTNTNKSNHRVGENVLLNALGQLEISGPENVMTYVTLESSCKKLKPHLIVFERYRKDLPDKMLYVRLFKAVKKFYSIYCGRDERFQKLFAKWQDQLQGLHEQFVDCEGDPDWYEESNVTNLCENAINIVNCYSDSLEMETSKSVAKAWKCLFQLVLNEAMIHPCQFMSMKQEFSLEDIFSSSGSSEQFNIIMIVLVGAIMSINIFFC